jgi:hypothetical protein
MYQFDAGHSLEAEAPAHGGLLEILPGFLFQQEGLVCNRCGYVELRVKDPQRLLQQGNRFFKPTEPEG